MNLRADALRRTHAGLMDAASVRFATDGYDGAALATIAAEAGATTGALFHHFANKRALFEAVAERCEAALVARIAATTPNDLSPRDTIDHVIAATLDAFADPATARILLIDAPNVLGLEQWREIEMRYGLGSLTTLVAALPGERAMESAEEARLLLALIIEAARTIAVSDDPATLRQAMESRIRQYVATLES